jgi:hypothetical protein
VQDLLAFLRQWDSVQGFIGFGTAYFIHFVSLLQCDLGVAGAIGEIGVAGGKSFAALAFTRQPGEGLLACDLFSTGFEKDNVPDANMPLFLHTLSEARIPKDDVIILKQSSLQLSDANLVHIAKRRFAAEKDGEHFVVGDGGFRLFHVDGGHYLEAAFHDINIASCSLVPGGVLLVDDLHNLGYPGVQEAFHRFMLEDPPARRLEPFLFTGRLFLTTPGYAEAYRRAIRRKHPGVHRSELYGVEVLLTHHLDIDLKYDDFESMLLGARPRAGPQPRQ